MAARTAQVQRGEVGQGRAEAGAPDDGVRAGMAAVGPLDTVGGEPGEHRLRLQKSGIASGPDGRHGHDVAEGGDPAGVAAAGVESAAAGGGDIEQGATVDVVRQEPRRALGHPRHLDMAVQGEVGGDLRAGVPAAHHDHVLPGEVGRTAVVHRVQMPPGEDGSAGDGGQERPRPAAGRADDRTGPPDAGIRFDQEPVCIAAYGVHTGAALDGQVVALLVVGEVVHHMPRARVRLPGLGGHEPAGQRGVLRRREQVQRVPHVLPRPARRRLRVQDHEVQTLAAQVVAGGEPCLPAADHHHIRVLRHGAVVTAPGANFLRQASAT